MECFFLATCPSQQLTTEMEAMRVFVAFNFALLYKQFSLDYTLKGHNLNSHWQTALEHAIRAGNDIHDQLFDFEGVNVSGGEN